MRSAILFGATGLIGNNLLELLLVNNDYSKIKIFTRKPINNLHPKLEIHVVNFNKIDDFANKISGDECFFVIGTTRNLTPKKQDYIDVELNIPKKISKIAKDKNINTFIYVSSGGANPESRNLYLQNKGKVEQYIINLKFEFLAIIQPSLLLGNRKNFRMGESIAKLIFKNLSFLFIGKLRPFKAIQANIVAMAIMIIIKNNKKDIYFSSDKLEDIANMNI